MKVSNVDASLGLIVSCFTNVVELYQKRNHSCFWLWQPRSPSAKDCLKEMGKTTKKDRFKLERGNSKEGRADPLRRWWLHARGHTREMAP